MDKQNNKVKKIVCPRCKGNGYIKIPHQSVENLDKSGISQCTMCESEGEINELESIDMVMFDDDPERMH